MKIKFSYYSFRFPNNIAVLCQRIQEEFNATYIDLPFLLPEKSDICEYKDANKISYENNKYFVANEKTDVHFKSKVYYQKYFFGVINITRNSPEYILWTTFYDDKIKNLISSFIGNVDIRIYSDPVRCSMTLRCDDI